MPKLNLAIELPQAESVVDALDVFTRLSLGQFEIVGEMIRRGRIKVRLDDNSARVATPAEADRADELLKELKRLLGHSANQSFGVGHSGVGTAAHRCYEIEKVIEHELAMFRDPNPSFRTVNYDGLMLRFTDDPEPKAHVA